MPIEKGTLDRSLEDITTCTSSGATLEHERPKKQEQLDEYLVKENFVPLGHHGPPRKMLVRRRKQKEESPVGVLCAMIVEHQLGTHSS